jgi:purine-cytosine permease-like protein
MIILLTFCLIRGFFGNRLGCFPALRFAWHYVGWDSVQSQFCAEAQCTLALEVVGLLVVDLQLGSCCLLLVDR